MDEWLNDVLTKEAKKNKDFAPNSGVALLSAATLEQLEKANTQLEKAVV